MNVKRVLFLCLFFGIIALPVQSQAPTRLTNPGAADLDPCGLPPTWAQFNSSSTFTTFEMTANCTYTSADVGGGALLWFSGGGPYTINGNGFSIIGPPTNFTIYVSNSGTVLNLNNVVITGGGTVQTVQVATSGTLNATNVSWSANRGRGALFLTATSTAVLRDVQFLNNQQDVSDAVGIGSALTVQTGSTATITNGIFRGNRNYSTETAVVRVDGSATTLTLMGCITFAGNVLADGATAATDVVQVSSPTFTNTGITGACPSQFSYWLSLTPQKKSKKTATPRPSATSRPLATTCIDLNQATGIAVRATYGLASGIQCQRLGGGGIGIQSIVEAGFIDAVDIWGYVKQGVEVCFPQAGNLLFLDASMMPRAAAPLASTVVNGMTCGAIETPGSIVLMPHS